MIKVFFKTFKLLFLILTVAVITGCFLFPPDIIYNSYLVPNLTDFSKGDINYSIGEDEMSVSYDVEGSRVEVTYITDKELNEELFPDDSEKGRLSTNPYTYGNWIDPQVGYTPNRFSVFRITVYNYTFGKMFVDPRKIVMYSDRGETFHPYSVSIAAEVELDKSFETYYKSLRGQSGNDFYRFNQRIGLVRGKAYGIDELVFKGDQYDGLIAFDTLHKDVKNVKLVLNDVVLRFDAYDRPADTMNIEFYFDRKIDKTIITREEKMKLALEMTTTVEYRGAQQIIGNRVGDNLRSSDTIDEMIQAHEDELNRCFNKEFREGDANLGEVTLSFDIEIDGKINITNVIETAIASEEAADCLMAVIRTFEFRPIEDDATGVAKKVNVLYPLEFREREEE